MDEVAIFGINYFKEHYQRASRTVQAKWTKEEAPEIIMDMTQKLGFRDNYLWPVLSAFIKEFVTEKSRAIYIGYTGRLEWQRLKKFRNSWNKLLVWMIHFKALAHDERTGVKKLVVKRRKAIQDRVWKKTLDWKKCYAMKRFLCTGYRMDCPALMVGRGPLAGSVADCSSYFTQKL